MSEQYELRIESQDRFTNEEGETKFGPVRISIEYFDARSETEAAQIANSKRTPFNNVNVNRI